MSLTNPKVVSRATIKSIAICTRNPIISVAHPGVVFPKSLNTMEPVPHIALKIIHALVATKSLAEINGLKEIKILRPCRIKLLLSNLLVP